MRNRRRIAAIGLGMILLAGCQRGAESDSETPADAGPAGAPTAASASVAAGDGRALTSNDGALRIVYTTLPDPIPSNEPFSMVVRVRTPGGEAVNDADLLVDAAMPEHGHGMNVEPTVDSKGNGEFVVEGMLFHMPGRWELYFDVTRDGLTARAQDEINLE